MYPTSEQILSSPIEFDESVIKFVRKWKRGNFNGCWSVMTEGEKFEALKRLVVGLDRLYNDNLNDVKYGMFYMYSPTNKTIVFDATHPSIISALHEFGHHLFGHSELEACRFSVWMFMTVFPKQYDKLTWKGHMLVCRED